jgi:hypothetical protein
MTRLIGIAYLVIGFLVVAGRGYFSVKGLEDVVSLVLGVILWPLILLGIDVNIGGGNDKGLLLPPAAGAHAAFARLRGRLTS